MRVAIVAPGAGPAFQRGREAAVGGAERQLAMLARALTERGHQVDILVAGQGPEMTVTGGGKVWPGFPLHGIPLLKLLHPKGSALLRWLRERESQVLLQRGASELTALSASVAALRGLPFVFMLASDTDLEPGREILPHPQDQVLFHESLRRVGSVVAQTRTQAKGLWRAYGLKAEVMPSFLESDPGGESAELGEAILWGGNLRPVKRPEWLLDLASRFPERRFIVYGGAAPGHEAYAERIRARMRQTPNLEFLGRVSPADLPVLFRRARILINSSESEGFPNTFLEAWRHGLRVLATVDPDGLLSGGMGVHADSPAGLRAGLAGLLEEDPATREAARVKARAYLDENHEFTTLARRWEKLLEKHVEEVPRAS